MATLTIEDVKEKIRAVPDFPKKGIIFTNLNQVIYIQISKHF